MKFYGTIKPACSGVFLFILLATGLPALAQNASSSPYSRYGIGDLQFGGYVKNLGMGGLSYGVHAPFNINITNPASYTDLVLTTFELGARANFIELKNTKGSGTAADVSFGYFSLGFPVKQKKWGMSFGLIPYSNRGYSITKTEENEAGDQRNLLFTGNGGLNQFYIGNAIAIGKGTSVGVNASFLFGTMNRVRRIYYPNGGYLNTRITDENSVGDLYFNFGLMQTFDSLRLAKSDSIVMFDKEKIKIEDSLKAITKNLATLQSDNSASANSQRENLMAATASLMGQLHHADSLSALVKNRKQRSAWSLTLGVTAAPSMHLKGKNTTLAENYLLTGLGTEVVRDTVQFIQSTDGKLVLPLSLGFGMAMKKGTKWLAGADFSMQNWQDYSFFGRSDSLANSWRIAVGAQFVPNDRSIKSYLPQMNYRIGFHYEQTYLDINNSQLNQMGISIGLGLPVKRSASMIQIAVEAGKRGTTQSNLIEENYIKCSLGFTLNDRWFIKPKYD